jgi:hypothetical protein
MTRSTDDLIASARRSLTEAAVAHTPQDRYAAAHLAALRAAAAVLASDARPDGMRGRVRSVWAVLPQVAAEFGEWADFFAAGARKRSAAMAGIPCVSHREADDLVRDAEEFLARVCIHLGIAYQAPLVPGLRFVS